MKKVLKIFLGVLFAALLIGTFVFLWQKTRPAKVVYPIVKPNITRKHGAKQWMKKDLPLLTD